MSNENTENTENVEVKEATEATAAAPRAALPTTQADLDAIIAARLQRERAKFSDYEDLVAKAARLDDLERAAQSEEERLRADLAAATERAEAAERARLKTEIAAQFGIASDNIDLIDGPDEETMRSRAERLAAMTAPAPVGFSLPGDRKTESGGGDVREAFGRRILGLDN